MIAIRITTADGRVTERRLDAAVEIGRQGSDLVFDDSQLSRRHLRLTPQPDGVLVEDLGSSNGVWLDGQRLAGARHVRPGSTLQAGRLRIEITREAPLVPFRVSTPQRRGVATRLVAPAVLTFAVIAATAIALILYFAGR